MKKTLVLAALLTVTLPVAPAIADPHGHGAAVAHAQPGEAPLAMVIPLCITAVASVALGFFPDFFMRFAHAVLP